MDEKERAKELFATGEYVKEHWKHQIWRNVPKDQIVDVIMAARQFHAPMGSGWTGKMLDTERIRENPDGSYDFESVYACEGGVYGIEDWDGIVLIGPNRRELKARFHVGSHVSYMARGQEHHGVVLRHSKKTIKLSSHLGGYWRIPWGQLEESLSD